MADTVWKVHYCYVLVPNRKGRGARILRAIREAGINLLAYSGFPSDGGVAQLDLVADDLIAVRRVAREEGWRLSSAKRAFVVQGTDEVGAVERHVRRLADAGISVTAADAISAGGGRYGMILWVKPKDYNQAAKALGAK